MKIHCAASVLTALLGWYLQLGLVEWCLIVFAITLVISAEMLNTAIEQVVDLASPQRHPLAKAAKDVAAGAVLVATFGAIAIGGIVLGPPLWKVLLS